jgi:hypothetical protein
VLGIVSSKLSKTFVPRAEAQGSGDIYHAFLLARRLQRNDAAKLLKFPDFFRDFSW